MSKGGGRPAVETRWRAVMSRFAGAGVSVSAFCRGESIPTQTFYYWRARLRPAQSAGVASKRAIRPSPSAPPRGFVDLGVLSSIDPLASLASVEPGALEIRLDLGAGVVLQIRRG